MHIKENEWASWGKFTNTIRRTQGRQMGVDTGDDI